MADSNGIQGSLLRLESLHDVPHKITIVIGRTKMTIGELLELQRGTVVELTKSAGESFDVLANNKLIARGEVTIVDDRFCVRVTEFAVGRGGAG